MLVCRSRKGALIEMPTDKSLSVLVIGRSRKGAWIEISPSATSFRSASVAPARERGLKFDCGAYLSHVAGVAPARERGLKCQFQIMVNQPSSRSRKGAWIEMPS